MKYIFISLMATGLLFSAGCKKTPPTPVPIPETFDNSFVINGGAFKNVTVNLKTVTSSAGAYSLGNKGTDVEIQGSSGDSLSIHMSILFEGNKIGQFSLGTGTDYMTINTTGTSGSTNDYTSNSGGLIKITQYDAVGGKIKGTFGGNFNNVGVDYSISNGTFAVVRTADVP
jgi:hypothetical protein